MNKLVLFFTLISCLTGCSSESNFSVIESMGTKEKPLEIVTRIITTKSPNFVQEFKDKSVIGLLITSENNGELYGGNSRYKNVKATARLMNDKIFWQQMPAVHVTFEPAIVYAYYPYREQEQFDAASIPVHISPDASQSCDYMYGTHAVGQKIVNSLSPMVMLYMNHALSLISFQVNMQTGETGDYQLNSIQLGNKAGGTALKCKGMMDIKTGRINGTASCNTPTRLLLPQPITLTTTYSDPKSLMVIPTSTPIAEGDIEALFTINGRSYKFRIPAGTAWKKGYKYLYKLSLGGETLTLKEVFVTSWMQGNGENAASSIL